MVLVPSIQFTRTVSGRSMARDMVHMVHMVQVAHTTTDSAAVDSVAVVLAAD